MAFLADHMWQSLQAIGCLGVFAFLTRHNPASFRQWLWRIAALKLVVPFALISAIGGWFSFPVTHSAQSPPATLMRLLEAVGPWFTPSRHFQGAVFGWLFVAEVLAVAGAVLCIRRALRAEAPRAAAEAGRLESDPDDHPPGVGFFNSALMTAFAMLAVLGPLTSGAVHDRLRRQALLRENAQSLEDAVIVMRPAAPGMGSRMRVTADADGVTIRNVTLQELGGVAYGISRFAVYSSHFIQAGETDWMTGERYDVRVEGRVIEPDDFDTYALRGPVTRKLAVDFGLEIYEDTKCQPPCGKWGSYVLPASALAHLDDVPPPPPEDPEIDLKPPALRRQFDDYLQAFNSGDRLTLSKFHQDHVSTFALELMGLEEELMLQKQTGGFDVLEYQERPRMAHGWVRARDSDALMEFHFQTESFKPFRVSLRKFSRGMPPKHYFPTRLQEAAAVSKIRADLAQRAKRDKFSGAVLVTRDGKVLIREAHGFSERESQLLNKLDTRFRVASLTKMFTAVAVLRLVQQGKVRLDDPIGKWVPELRSKPAAPATIHQLLTHTGGLGDIHGTYYLQHHLEFRTHADYVSAYAGQPLALEPGARYQYSNLGYLMLGRLIETASGKSWHDYVREAVFEPAGMTRTGSTPEDEPVEDRSRIYEKPLGMNKYVSARYVLDYRATAAAHVYSTIDDLAKFVWALRSNRLLDPEYTALMLEPHQKVWEGYSYGYGMMFYSAEWTGHWTGHSGSYPGMNCELWFSPETRYLVIVLSNIDPPSAHNVSDFITARLPVP
jgi:CubicO group peptidase (beta-lactamase class C family)